MYLHVDPKWFEISIECNKKLKALEKEAEDSSGKKRVHVLISLDDKDIFIKAWDCNPVLADFLICAVKLPFRKGERYSIHCRFGEEDSIRVYGFERFKTDDYIAVGYKPIPTGTESYEFKLGYKESPWQKMIDCNFRIEKTMNPKLAKKRYKELLKAKLIGKTAWDDWINYWDFCCHACTERGQARMALSTPSWGRVLVSTGALAWHVGNTFNQNRDGNFCHNGIFYDRIPNAEFHLPKFWTKEEFEKVAETYKPDPQKIEWFNCTDIEMATVNFEQFWEKNGKWWRDPEGKVYQFGHNPVIGAYERVYSIDWQAWLDDWNFEELWDKNLTQEQIDKRGNDKGGAFHIRETHLKDSNLKLWSDRIVSKDYNGGVDLNKKDWDELIRLGCVEKVVTKGWHTEPYSNSVPCPVCQEMHRVAESTDAWKPAFHNIRERYNYMKEDLKRKRQMWGEER